MWIQVRACAQNYFGLLHEGRQVLSAGVNANPNLNANADYLFGFDYQGKTLERYGIIAQANFPIFSQKGFDFDFRVGAGALVAFSDKFKSIAGLSWNLSRTADLNGRYLHSGFKIDLLPGYYGSKWVFAPHLALNYQPWIHIQHSDYAIEAFRDLYPNNDGQYRGPKDGWFYQNHFTLQAGVGVAYLRPNWQLNLIAGFQHQPNRLSVVALPDIGILPFYGGLNFGYAIKNQ
ncbi:MAG: hypothetical protein ACK4NS_05580 [Saprospiraceae bacterium]